jgi:acid phosphatase (class A)
VRFLKRLSAHRHRGRCPEGRAEMGLSPPLFAAFLLVSTFSVQAAPLDTPPGYLTGQGPELRQFISPAPQPHSAEEGQDRRIFREDRPSVGSARWKLAIADVDEALPTMLSDFSEAAGTELSPDRQPALARLLVKMRRDTAAAADALKAEYRRPRPFLLDQGPVCQDRKLLAQSFDYPSGHTIWGTAVALVLAELRPDRAATILARGRDYGESRVVCGAHSQSAVRAGREAAAGLVAILHGSARFREDLEQARHELRGSQKE